MNSMDTVCIILVLWIHMNTLCKKNLYSMRTCGWRAAQPQRALLAQCRSPLSRPSHRHTARESCIRLGLSTEGSHGSQYAVLGLLSAFQWVHRTSCHGRLRSFPIALVIVWPGRQDPGSTSLQVVETMAMHRAKRKIASS